MADQLIPWQPDNFVINDEVALTISGTVNKSLSFNVWFFFMVSPVSGSPYRTGIEKYGVYTRMIISNC